MEQTLQALTGILLKAIPTIIILVILHQFLKAVLFSPVEKMLKERSALTHGARNIATESLAAAERKTLEYEAKLRDAKSAVYKDQEETRKQWLDQQAQQLERAHASATALVANVKKEIAAEALTARTSLESSSQALADQIATSILSGRAR
ncbi:MAG: ATP synthase F0 subunit B [Acidobacteriota bacterium]